MAVPVELTTVKVPVRLVFPAPLKLTAIVQVPPPATVLPEHVSAPLLNLVPATVAVPNVTGLPPRTLTDTVLDTVPG